MKNFIYATAALALCSCASVKQDEVLQFSSPSPVHSESTSTAEAIAPPRTNRVFHFTASWGYDSNSYPYVDHFDLLIGTNESNYTISENAGTNLSYTFTRTNWSEASMRHWIVVVARSADEELFADSDYSSEAHWPLFPPNHIRILWDTSYPQTQIQRTIDLFSWNTVATVSNTNEFSEPMDMAGLGFYRIDKPETLRYQLFNPNP